MFLTSTAQALQPNRLLTEYIRESWDDQKGFPGGPVHAIAQTPDGYLWLGTEKGLVRFDGLSFLLFNQTNSVLPPGPIVDLLTDGEGNLWIRPQSRNLIRYFDGSFQNVNEEIDRARSGITAMCLGTNREALFSVRLAGVYSYRAATFSEEIPLPNGLVISAAQTRDGKFWMGTRDLGLLYSYDGKLSAVTKGLPDTKVNSLLATDRELWIGTDNGLVRWDGNQIISADLPAALKHVQVLSLKQDADSNIWIGTSQGLLRLNAGGLSSFDEGVPGSSEFVNAIFEDREGNLWIGTRRGIERLRDSSFMTYPASKDPSAPGSGAIYVDPQGRKWFAPSEGGLYWQKDRQVGYVRNDGLDHDVVYSLMGSQNELWLGRQRGGLTHLKFEDGRVATRTYTQADGLVQNSIYALCESRDGTVWVGTLNGGVSSLKDGKFTNYMTANGLVSNSITAIKEGDDGTMWFATVIGLCSLSQGRWRTYNSLDGLPPGRLNCLFEDANGVLWIGSDNGVAVLTKGQVYIPHQLPQALLEPVLGIAGDRAGFLWLSTSNHVLRVYRDKLMAGAVRDVDVREFGLADGLRSLEGVKQDRPVFMDPFGQIWFSTYRGLSVVDPDQVADNFVPAIAHIESIVADGNTVELQAPIRIPSAHRRLIFRCTGLSFSIPERVRFKYRLDNYDKNWSEPVATREVVYTNLGPGSYRFRLIASNSAGLWNGSESSIEFEIEPAFYQRWWFRVAGLMVLGLSILFLYRLKLERLTNQMNVRFEERLAERTRIAQDLHDTLLQGFLSASMQLHIAAEQLPLDSPAKPLISRVLLRMRQVTEEGRTALKTLRTPSGYSYDLVQSFSKIQDELALRERIDYRVTVEGPPRQLHPVIRDEIYHIGREALMNAFRHAKAKSIELELEYGPKQIRVLVRDDGQGIDQKLLRSGREGHWGIAGMRERAEEIGATLRLWSRGGAGTEVELSIPGKIAYESQPSHRPWKWFTNFFPRTPQQDGKK